MSSSEDAKPPLTPEEFVALALAQPIESGAAKYGYSLRVASGNPKPPGIIALTWITGKNDAERERIRTHSRQNVQDFVKEPGFISIVTGFVGLRGFTVTAWEDEEAMQRALGKHHAQAMKELFAEDFVASVWTSVWKPTRINRLWVRCTACAALEDVSDDHRGCTKCGAELPERPAYW
jgi:quinol monooxygenase YgiN